MSDTPLVIDRLSVRLPPGADRAFAVEDVSLALKRGEILCVVGESGSGKTVTAQAVMGLLPENLPRPAGRVLFEDQDLLEMGGRARRAIIGNRIAMIFQDPMTSLNPVLTIGWQISEALRLHKGLNPAAARKRASELLAMVGIPRPAERLEDYPHQFSGGMRQRVKIGRAHV